MAKRKRVNVVIAFEYREKTETVNRNTLDYVILKALLELESDSIKPTGAEILSLEEGKVESN